MNLPVSFLLALALTALTAGVSATSTLPSDADAAPVHDDLAIPVPYGISLRRRALDDPYHNQGDRRQANPTEPTRRRQQQPHPQRRGRPQLSTQRVARPGDPPPSALEVAQHFATLHGAAQIELTHDEAALVQQ